MKICPYCLDEYPGGVTSRYCSRRCRKLSESEDGRSLEDSREGLFAKVAGGLVKLNLGLNEDVVIE